MAPACKHEDDADLEHPVVAWAGIVAIALAILLILWARVEVHGTRDLESALSEVPERPALTREKPSPQADRARRNAELDDAVATGRWAAGFAR